MKLPFGKYKDHLLSDPAVPTHYLEWLEQQDFIRGPLRVALNEEIGNRRDNRPGAGKVVKEGR